VIDGKDSRVIQMPKPAIGRHKFRMISEEYVSIRKKLRSLEATALRMSLSQSQLDERSDLYKRLNEAKVNLIKLGCDPNQIGKPIRKVGLSGPRSSPGFKGSRSKGGVGIYSRGNASKLWK